MQAGLHFVVCMQENQVSHDDAHIHVWVYSLSRHFQLYSGTRYLVLQPNLQLRPYFVCANIKSPDKYAWTCRLSESWVKILNFPKSRTLDIQILKLAVWLLNVKKSNSNGPMSFDELKINQRSYYILPNSGFWGWLSLESQPQNPENFHPWWVQAPRLLTIFHAQLSLAWKLPCS